MCRLGSLAKQVARRSTDELAARLLRGSELGVAERLRFWIAGAEGGTRRLRAVHQECGHVRVGARVARVVRDHVTDVLHRDQARSVAQRQLQRNAAIIRCGWVTDTLHEHHATTAQPVDGDRGGRIERPERARPDVCRRSSVEWE
jgi:hypothetical protein